MALAALTTALILLPVSVHRRLFRLRLKATLVSSADRIAKVALAGVGLLSVGTSAMVFDVTAGRAAGLTAGGRAAGGAADPAGLCAEPAPPAGREGELTWPAPQADQRSTPPGGTAGKWVKEHGLLLANIGLFVLFFGGMILSGAADYSEDQLAHGEPAVTVLEYLGTGAFLEATFENWESEFLQMGMYVILTVFLFQKGSSESKPVGRAAPQDEDPRDAAAEGRHPVARAARRLGPQAL